MSIRSPYELFRVLWRVLLCVRPSEHARVHSKISHGNLWAQSIRVYTLYGAITVSPPCTNRILENAMGEPIVGFLSEQAGVAVDTCICKWSGHVLFLSTSRKKERTESDLRGRPPNPSPKTTALPSGRECVCMCQGGRDGGRQEVRHGCGQEVFTPCDMRDIESRRTRLRLI